MEASLASRAWCTSPTTRAFTSRDITRPAIAARLLSVGANLAFLAMSAAAVASRRIRASLGLDRLTIAWAGLVWAVSIIQALVEHGDNPRWLMPLQMIVFCVVLRGVWAWRNSRVEMKA